MPCPRYLVPLALSGVLLVACKRDATETKDASPAPRAGNATSTQTSTTSDEDNKGVKEPCGVCVLQMSTGATYATFYARTSPARSGEQAVRKATIAVTYRDGTTSTHEIDEVFIHGKERGDPVTLDASGDKVEKATVSWAESGCEASTMTCSAGVVPDDGPSDVELALEP